MKKPILLAFCMFACIIWANAQTQLTGTVTDATTGNPMPFVSVTLPGTVVGINTDDNGTYSVTIPQGATKIQFSFVGYSDVEEEINNRTVINIAMQPTATSLEQVVVVGYGTQKKVHLTGSVAHISSESLKDRPVTTISAALQGQMPGVAVTQDSGQPGADGGSIRIRGIGTMGNSNPLIIVDGLESKMDDVNPNDIGSISVLKDAAASAIYGARAANGVILITTKRGTTGKAKVNYNAYVGWQKATDLPKLLHSADYARLYNIALENDGLPAQYTEDAIAKYASGSDPDNYPDTRWMDELTKGSGLQQSHTLSVAGGSESMKYMISLGYLEQQGITKRTSFSRYNTRINLDGKVSDLLSVGTNVALSYSQKKEPISPYTSNYTQIFRQAYRIPGTFVNKYSEAAGGGWGRHIDGNPIAWVEDGGLNQTNTPHINGSAFAELKIIEGLKIKGIAGVDYNFDDRKLHVVPVTYADGYVQGNTSVRDYMTRYLRTTLQAFINYEKTIAKHHNLEVMLGVSREKYDYKTNEAYRKNQPSNDLNQINAGSAEGQDAKGDETNMRQGSVFGRLNYNFKGKYLLGVNIRHDGSSRFAQGRRWGTFPSFSAGWRISEEGFMESLKPIISNLKLRGSWGQLGNDRIGDYKYINLITLQQNYPFFGSFAQGAIQTAGSNAKITWETSTELDFGIDIDLFKNKLSIVADWYKRTTDDILTAVPVSQIYGLTAPTVNAGSMENKGIELQVIHRNTIKDFSYDVGVNFSYNKNVVTKYPNPSKEATTIRQEGYAWDAYYGYKHLGYYQTQEQVDNAPKISGTTVKMGDLMWKDQLTVDTNGDGKPDAGDGVINGDDRVVIGSPQPKYTLGFNLGARYKGFDVSAFFQGAFGVYRLHHNEAFWPFVDTGNGQEKHKDYWTPDNRNARYPILRTKQTHNYQTSTFNVLKSNYLRLKNLQVGYTLPQSVLKYLKIERVRAFFSGQNIWTIKSKMLEGLDPEVVNANYVYPNVATYTFGLDITF